MAMIYVRAKQGRKAFYEGRIIPTDKFIPVTDDPYVRRLIDHWGDLEESADASGTKPTSKRPKQVERGPTPPVGGGGRTTIQPPGQQAPGTGAPRPRE